MAAKKKKPSRNYSKTTIKILFGGSDNECAEPQCSTRVIANTTKESDSAVIGEIAHIYAFSEDGPRGSVDITPNEINHHSNLIVLCPTHHTLVDKQHETYTADLLREWKNEHIRKHSDIMRAKVSDIGYAELEFAAKALMSEQALGGEEDLAPVAPIPIMKKIMKNDLSRGSAASLKMGLAMHADVKAMLLSAAQLAPTFPDQLRNGFQEKYLTCVEDGLCGDELFDALYVWSGSAESNPKRALAGLCLLSYLFVLCEIFESV